MGKLSPVFLPCALSIWAISLHPKHSLCGIQISRNFFGAYLIKGLSKNVETPALIVSSKLATELLHYSHYAHHSKRFHSSLSSSSSNLIPSMFSSRSAIVCHFVRRRCVAHRSPIDWCDVLVRRRSAVRLHNAFWMPREWPPRWCRTPIPRTTLSEPIRYGDLRIHCLLYLNIITILMLRLQIHDEINKYDL